MKRISQKDILKDEMMIKKFFISFLKKLSFFFFDFRLSLIFFLIGFVDVLLNNSLKCQFFAVAKSVVKLNLKKKKVKTKIENKNRQFF